MPNIPHTFKDHFSGHAKSYAASRPHYPAELFSYLAGLCRERECAWDCATGNGQAAHALAAHFESVVATDASATQIDAALPHPRIDFRVAPAEHSGLERASFDLITVAQALHWFDVDAFFAEATSVLRPGGVLAYWCYGLCSITPECDEIVRGAYSFVDRYWLPERATVERGYRDIVPPMPTIETPAFRMQLDWTADQMIDYMRTWSASQRYRRATGADPLAGFVEPLRARWGPDARPVRWPLHLSVAPLPDAPLE